MKENVVSKLGLALVLLALLAGPVLAQGDLAVPQQVGEEMSLTYRSPDFIPTKSGKMELAWREEIYMPGASYIAVHFGHFDLPEGAEAVVRSADGTRSWTFRGYGKSSEYMEDGFWGIHIADESAIVEVFSKAPLRGGEVVIDRFAHGYPEIEAGGFSFGFKDWPEPITNKAICGSNDAREAKCYSGTIYERSRAVARLLINGLYRCTGWLVGADGHFLTNNHCIANSSDAANTDFEFMAEGSSCSTNCRSGGACAGTVEATSASFVQTHVHRDFTLLKLSWTLPPKYGFLQMRETGAVNGERIYIPNHPRGWGKQLSVVSTHPSNPGGFCEVDSLSRPACIGGSETEVGYYCDTQDGSSGSPVLAESDHCVVALHHCANCPNRGTKIEHVVSSLNAAGNLPLNALGCGSLPAPTGLDMTYDSGDEEHCTIWDPVPGAAGYYLHTPTYQPYRILTGTRYCRELKSKFLRTWEVSVSAFSATNVEGARTTPYVNYCDFSSSC